VKEKERNFFFFFLYLYFLCVCCLEDLEYWNGSSQNRFYIIAVLCGDKKSKGIEVLKFLKKCLCT
jgi:hypothetical protein